jgi:diguanylate cyclase (GGDEF)-like protein
VKRRSPEIPLVLTYRPREENAQPRAESAGADAWLVGPLKRTTVSSCVKSLLRIKALEEKVASLEADEPRTADALSDFGFFKRLLLMEVKRSRRYRYPIAFLLLSVDRIKDRLSALPGEQRKAAMAEVLAAVTHSVRDIDLAVPSGDDRVLVFLPHTPRQGALLVAGRLRERLRRLGAFPDSTASVGVAAFEPGSGAGEVSFGTLMRDALEALRKAQADGGNKIEAAEKKSPDQASVG